MNKKVITFGEVMMRLSTPGYERFTQANSFDVAYAGSEANVASSLSLFDIPAAHVTRFPDNDLGKAATQSLRKLGVDTQYIIYGDQRLGLYFFENGAIQRSPRIVYDRFDSSFAYIDKGMVDWDSIMKEASWFHWSGITPAISAGAAAACLEAVQAARRHQVKVSGDINYRRNLWNYGKTALQVMPALIENTDIVVGGPADFENCAGVKSATFQEGSNKLMQQFPAVRKVTSTNRVSVSSSHNKISGVLWDGKQVHESKEYDLTHIVDRVGTGDAFMAGLIYAWLNTRADGDALAFGVAACALKHTIEQDVNLVTAAEVDELVKGENIGKLLR